jgi:hypothetical protein
MGNVEQNRGALGRRTHAEVADVDLAGDGGRDEGGAALL